MAVLATRSAVGMTGYRWWTVFGWWQPRDRGVKLGPMTLAWYRTDLFDPQRCDRWHFTWCALGSVLWDTGLRIAQRQPRV